MVLESESALAGTEGYAMIICAATLSALEATTDCPPALPLSSFVLHAQKLVTGHSLLGLPAHRQDYVLIWDIGLCPLAGILKSQQKFLNFFHWY